MVNTKKGAALLQVLLVTVILAGMATMLLRASLSRTTSARKTRRTVSAQMLVNSCMAEVNTLWSLKSAESFARDLSQCIMYCNSSDIQGTCPAAQAVRKHVCHITVNGVDYDITAEFTTSMPSLDNGNKCQLSYTVESDTDSL